MCFCLLKFSKIPRLIRHKIAHTIGLYPAGIDTDQRFYLLSSVFGQKISVFYLGSKIYGFKI